MQKLRLFLTMLILGGLFYNAHAQFSGIGSGTTNEPYQITNAAQLDEVRNFTGTANAGKHFRLMNNIDLAAWIEANNPTEGWQPIGTGTANGANAFRGFLHGGGFSVQNLWIDRSGSNYVGLFGSVNSGSVDSIKIEIATGKSITGNNYVGCLSGNVVGTKVTVCKVKGTINGNANIGGLIGAVTGSSQITKDTSACVVNGANSNVGGLIGNCSAPVTNCQSYGSVNNAGDYTGGLVGYANGTVSDCHSSSSVTNVGDVYVGNFMGGLIGANFGEVTNCSATGNVNGTMSLGGLVGDSYAPITDCRASGTITGNNNLGGLVGTSDAVTNSFATGNVNSAGERAGGLVGDTYGAITKCYATGTVTGGKSTGGLIGRAEGIGDVVDCFAKGNVSGTGSGTDFGGLVGDSWSSIINCYASGNVIAPNNMWVGGLVGSIIDEVISDCYVSGTIVGRSAGNCLVGGIAGEITNTTISNCVVASPSITAGTSVFRIVAEVTGASTIENTFAWESMLVNGVLITNGTASNQNGLNKTLAELRTQTTYQPGQNWDFTTKWNIWENKSYPYFTWQSAPVYNPYYDVTTLHFELRNPATTDSVVVYNSRTKAYTTILSSAIAPAQSQNSKIYASQLTDTLSLTVYENGLWESYPVKALPAYTITAGSGANGSITPNGTVTVLQGNSQTFTFAPSTGYRIVQVLVDGTNNPGAVAAGSYTFTNVSENHTISVSYDQIPYTITASSGPNGSINPSGTITVIYGSSKSFTFTPNTGYRIEQVLVDGTNNPAAVTAGSYTFSNITTDHTISVSYERIPYTITANNGPNGSISPKGVINVFYDDAQTFTFTPDPHYEVFRVFVDGNYVENSYRMASYTFSNITANHSIQVDFTAIKHTVEASRADNYGTISPEGSLLVNDGGTIIFAIAPNTNCAIKNVVVDGNSVGAVTSYTFSNVTTNHTIVASFERQQLSITASAGTGGLISPAGVTKVYAGDNQSYTITPNANYKIESVLIDGTNNPGAVASGTFTFTDVQANHTIAATFSRIQYTINAGCGTGGSITPNGPTTVNAGDSKTFTFTANSGYLLDSVFVDNSYNAAASVSGSYTFSNVQGNHTIYAKFKNTVSTQPADKSGIVVYPNPTSGPITVDCPASLSQFVICIYDLVGKKVFETKEKTFDISHLPKGAYVIRVNGKTAKIVKL